jgi:probable phosphoglycerate mutase
MNLVAGRFFIARHGETVFNAARRMQGDAAHTPLTRAGFAQADAMGAALRARLGARPALTLWASPTGRALQTLAVIAEHLDLDWHRAATDARLGEMGMGEWGGRLYGEILAEVGTFFDPATGLFTRRAPRGEWYDDVALRLLTWLGDTAGMGGDRLIVMHGLSSRVLRGLLLGLEPDARYRAPVAPGLPQGAMVCIEDGVETLLPVGAEDKKGGGGTY